MSWQGRPILQRNIVKRIITAHCVARYAVRPVPPAVTQIHFEWPYPDMKNLPRSWKLKSTVACFFAGLGGKAILNIMNTTKIHNLDRLKSAIFNRPSGVPLITVANHESCIDDPCLISILMSNKELMQQQKMRWGLAASDICYRKPWHGAVMALGKCPPCVRGMGVYQKAVDFVIDRLNEGDWLHIFPEGKVNMERKRLYRLKWGIGRIISELNVPPIIIPFWHVGMANVLPNQLPYYPRLGKKVLVNIGKPIDVTAIMATLEEKKAVEKRKIITDYIQAEMEILRRDTLALAKQEGFSPESNSDTNNNDGVV